LALTKISPLKSLRRELIHDGVLVTAAHVPAAEPRVLLSPRAAELDMVFTPVALELPVPAGAAVTDPEAVQNQAELLCVSLPLEGLSAVECSQFVSPPPLLRSSLPLR
jgi:hypothetical protein